MHIDLSGKRALVGGSSSGIGLGIAQQLAASGASVTLMARRENRLRELVNDLPKKQGQKHQYLVVDFTDFQAYKRKIQDYLEAQTVDILVNNTQGPPAGTSLEKGVNDYQEAFDLLFKSVVFTTEKVLEGMMARQWGRVVNVTSISVKEPLPNLVLSNTIRAAVVTWAKSLSRDVGPYGITVNNILTGYFDTERLERLNIAKAESQKVPLGDIKKSLAQQVPVQRIGRPEEYGYLVSFLASEQAAYLSGANIPLDGGLLHSL